MYMLYAFSSRKPIGAVWRYEIAASFDPAYRLERCGAAATALSRIGMVYFDQA